MIDGDPIGEGDDPRITAATAWFARMRSEEISKRESQAFVDWLADHENLAAYRQVEELWEGIEPLREPILREAREKKHGFRFSARKWALAACFAVAAVTTSLTTYVLVRPDPVTQMSFASGRSGQRTIELADGSVVILDVNSTIRTSMSSGLRRIDVEAGRALFKVHHDSSRPFVVHIDDKSVTALGTEFVVDKLSDDIRVALLTGRLRVAVGDTNAPARAVEIASGTEIRISGDGAWRMSTLNSNAARAWTDGNLVFDNALLRDVALEIGRYTDREIVIMDEKTAEQRITAVLRAGDINTFLRAVEISDVARVTEANDGTITLQQK